MLPSQITAHNNALTLRRLRRLALRDSLAYGSAVVSADALYAMLIAGSENGLRESP